MGGIKEMTVLILGYSVLLFLLCILYKREKVLRECIVSFEKAKEKYFEMGKEFAKIESLYMEELKRMMTMFEQASIMFEKAELENWSKQCKVYSDELYSVIAQWEILKIQEGIKR